jgi:succinylarginine dihydrolase
VAAREVNFDGLVGPSHNYAGLSYGNVASAKNAGKSASPKEAALQGLRKMALLSDLGVPQAVLPPQPRPDLGLLRRLGFTGTDPELLSRAAREAPALLAAAYSASAMWTANAATVSPSADSQDGKVHFTPANLMSKLHRSIEPETTGRILRAVFADPRYFEHHPALPASDTLGDEGAANHTRLAAPGDRPGVQIFVFGRAALDPSAPRPREFPARQTLEASQAIARLHRLRPENTLFLQQSPEVIDAGVFHNDVIAVGHRDVLLYHQRAFADGDRDVERIAGIFEQRTGQPLVCCPATDADLSVADAVGSYLFNSQLVATGSGELMLIAPAEAEENPRVRGFIERVIAAGGPIRGVHFLDLRQSMQNGGGPACLRLRVALDDRELAAMNPAVRHTPELHRRLIAWVERFYRDRLDGPELADPALIDEGRRALDELTQILALGSVYDFQRIG